MTHPSLRTCLISEEQAIAIYVSECWVLERTEFGEARRATLDLCRSILAEERHHRMDVGAFVPGRPRFQLQLGLSRAGG